ncbi:MULTISPECIES: aldo/keto reductase [Pseudoalteromonas]|uniref:Aldo/keto reductase n=1 Tax=Pseudoalteromonas amylolytica TaxID=1859457 RepID=A0A1S1MTM2_9GAMM|nr:MULTISPECIES: aldo/keto reductase [Pseudoalteromonas]OHU88414.1 aldo/keto reductase [Pseudoalteromonas sp. JW3]OHU90257.1 aldo/keto reductase [Pseudoalteromonas amylolytica]
MQFSRLGSSTLDVSRVCLGSMTWGLQNNQHDADEQINYALSHGINFMDTAELYAVPPSEDTYGETEKIIGNWLARHQEKRQQVVLASKIAGGGLRWIRGGAPISAKTIIEAVDASLQRLNTDYIDLYQLHWPNRNSPHFANHWPGMVKFSDVDREQQLSEMLEILQALQTCIDNGKIRHWGLSDDTTWGINTYLRLASEHNLAKPVAIQNEFNLLHTKDWPYLIENCIHEDVAYLPWSPLGAGALTGKYIDGARPEGSRWTYVQRNGLFRDTPHSNQAVKAYVQLAQQFGITPAQMALAWVNQVDGVTSTIIGATSMAQLKENLQAFELTLDDAQQAAIGELLQRFPSPF